MPGFTTDTFHAATGNAYNNIVDMGLLRTKPYARYYADYWCKMRRGNSFCLEVGVLRQGNVRLFTRPHPFLHACPCRYSSFAEPRQFKKRPGRHMYQECTIPAPLECSITLTILYVHHGCRLSIFISCPRESHTIIIFFKQLDNYYMNCSKLCLFLHAISHLKTLVNIAKC